VSYHRHQKPSIVETYAMAVQLEPPLTRLPPDDSHLVSFGNAASGTPGADRSTLVNIDRVRELRPLDKGEFQVILHNGAELKLSRNFRAALPRLAGAVV
jgi:hypothetical protein